MSRAGTQILIVLLAISHAWMYRIGGTEARAKLATVEKETKDYKDRSEKDAKEKDNEYRKSLAAVRADWNEWMRTHPVKAAPIRARVCDNQAGNDQLSAAVQEYIAAVGRFRTEVEGQLRAADDQARQLDCATSWAGGIEQ